MFRLTPKEDKAAKVWFNSHVCKKPKFWQKKIQHPQHWYCFAYTAGIGISVVIKCDCGEEKNITDYGSW